MGLKLREIEIRRNARRGNGTGNGNGMCGERKRKVFYLEGKRSWCWV